MEFVIIALNPGGGLNAEGICSNIESTLGVNCILYVSKVTAVIFTFSLVTSAYIFIGPRTLLIIQYKVILLLAMEGPVGTKGLPLKAELDVVDAGLDISSPIT